jgi:hypothetical protein
VKGIITALIMIAISLGIIATKTTSDSLIGYSIYIVYAAGIIWTVVDYAKHNPESRTFGTLFSQGFKCFIIVTLLMVAFTGIIFQFHPEWAEDSSKAYHAYLQKQGNNTPLEIEKLVATHKKQFTLSNIASAIFGYLITGALMTAVASGFLLRRK